MTTDTGDEHVRRPRPTGAAVEPAAGLSIRVLDTGWMELGRPGSDERLLCDEAGTAMWIALCQSSWNLGDAAAALARIWDASPWAIRDAMRDWISALCDAGLLEV